MDHAEKLYYALSCWLRPDNRRLKVAIDQTVEEGLFSFADLKYQIIALKRTLTLPALRKWLSVTSTAPGSLSGKKVLALNAGNLPLVGVHDLIGITLSGASYLGKISSKDPYLLPSLLSELREHCPDRIFSWSTSLNDFKSERADALIFTGSEENQNEVTARLSAMQTIRPDTPLLLRTSHFSIAWIEGRDTGTIRNLTEAMLRYGGQGCRSVAMVVAPFGLKQAECLLIDHAELFWLHNPPHKPPSGALKYRSAYNKASGTDQLYLDYFLFEEKDVKPTHPSVVQWIQGDENTLKSLVLNYKDGLQTIYREDSKEGSDIGGFITEPLSSAQEPPLWWKPDRIDTLQWLTSNLQEIA